MKIEEKNLANAIESMNSHGYYLIFMTSPHSAKA